MIKSKLFITSAIIAMSAVAANASACPCPDKPMPQNVLAPVIQTAELTVPSITAQPVVATPVTQQITQPAPALTAPVIANSTAAVQNEPAVVQSAQASEYGSGTTDTIADTPAAAYENLLGRRISKGAGDLNLFDYAGTKSSGEDKIVRDYIAYLSAQNPDTMNAAEATAYWANLYNAETVRLIIDNYPVKSIRKIGNGFTGPWKKNTLVVNGKDTSLDHIEHGILRKQFPSPYVHYMVNCASIGCPNLSTKLWKAETLEADQFAAAEAYINSPRGVAIQGNKLEISSIYKWFKDDFGGKSGLLPHFRKHARPELASVIDNGAKIDGYEYNWSLNE